MMLPEPLVPAENQGSPLRSSTQHPLEDLQADWTFLMTCWDLGNGPKRFICYRRKSSSLLGKATSSCSVKTQPPLEVLGLAMREQVSGAL